MITMYVMIQCPIYNLLENFWEGYKQGDGLVICYLLSF